MCYDKKLQDEIKKAKEQQEEDELEQECCLSCGMFCRPFFEGDYYVCEWCGEWIDY